MLSRFTIGNFRSFDKNQVLSLNAGIIQNHKERLFQKSNIKLLKFASIFGANAAGKSNFIRGMNYAQNAIIKGTDNRFFEERKNDFFRLNPNNKETPSFFEFEICLNDTIYVYGLEILMFTKKITKEWLHKQDKAKGIIIFSRNTDTGSSYFNEDYLNDDTFTRMSYYLEDFNYVTNKAFLSDIVSNKNELYKNNNKLEILKEVYNWIYNLDISYPDTIITGYDCFSERNIDDLIDALRIFKIGISKVNKTQISKEQALDKVSPDIRKKIEDSIQKACPPDCNKDISNCESCGFRMSINGRLIFVTFNNRDPVFTEITFEHNNVKDVSFSLAEESDGTQRLLDLLSILFTKKENSVFVIDEIDRSLHPQLTWKFIDNFLKYAEKKNIQLLITSHETHILNLELLRQDEIFFAETTPTGNSVIYSFEKFKERFDKKIEKAYLEGRYGAVPLFDSLYYPSPEDLE